MGYLLTNHLISEAIRNFLCSEFLPDTSDAGHIIQSADGSESITVYSTGEVFEEVLNRVDGAYPEFDTEAFANEQAKEIIEANTVGNSAAGPDDVDLTEEELKQQIQDRLKDKNMRIAAERRYMTFSEITKPEVQNQIAAQVQSVQQSILDGTAQFWEIKYKGKLLFTVEQTRLLFYSFAIAWWTGSWQIPILTIAATKEAEDVGDRFFNNDEGDVRGNSFKHSYWAAKVGTACTGIPWIGPEIGRWWAYEFTAAREGASREPTNLMDLHNDAVGAKVYYENANSKWYYITIRCGWVHISIPIFPYVDFVLSSGDLQNKLYSMARNAAHVERDNGRWEYYQTDSNVSIGNNQLLFLTP